MRHSLNDRFTVSFEGPEEAALATQALASLDQAYWRIGDTLSTFPNRPIPVVLYTAQEFCRGDFFRKVSGGSAAHRVE